MPMLLIMFPELFSCALLVLCCFSKKPVSPQSIENSEVIPSLMDISSDIKLTLPNSGPLLPNPVHSGASSHTQLSNSNSSWPVIDGSGSPAPGTSSKTELLSNNSNNRVQVMFFATFF